MVDERHKTEELTGSREGGTDMTPGAGGKNKKDTPIEDGDGAIKKDNDVTDR